MSKNMTDFYVPALMTDNVTEIYSFLTVYGYNRSNVAFENGNLAPEFPAVDILLCELFAGWGLVSKGILTGFCSLLCTSLMIILYCCICCRVHRLQRRRKRQIGVQTSTRRTLITTALIVGTFLLAWGPPSWLLLMVPLIVENKRALLHVH